jgi:hypothetical protein
VYTGPRAADDGGDLTGPRIGPYGRGTRRRGMTAVAPWVRRHPVICFLFALGFNLLYG